VTSYGLGLTTIAQRDFLLGTLASLPSMAGYVALGAFGKQSLVLGRTHAGAFEWLLLAVGIATLLWATVRVTRVTSQMLQAEAR
jgi:uncharacterized membrane protein YdjX (TVP38/TMEM64 family)